MAPGLDAGPRRGEIWHYGFRSPDKRRPVVILTRQEVLPLLHTAMVAPITSTIRGLPSEVVVGPDEGLRHGSAINLDHVQTVEQNRLHRYVGSLSPTKMRQVCRALAIATGCA
ncbi:MAG: type II toxin-antitoxin system PemK/MazF family toxin [Chloroflexi bacterium]|nr:type II toxin-antitoxin system PemK/MazF family toxin [Chloroflexota bacterium]